MRDFVAMFTRRNVAALSTITPVAITGLALGGMLVWLVSTQHAQALPSYARQTGQQCAACHNGFPELTPYGRLFKLNGYTFTGGDLKGVPPIAAMMISSFTNTAKDQPGGAAPSFGPNNNFAVTGSLFYGGKIVDHVGAFAQLTFDGVGNTVSWDNTDIRYANTAQLAGESWSTASASITTRPSAMSGTRPPPGAFLTSLPNSRRRRGPPP